MKGLTVLGASTVQVDDNGQTVTTTADYSVDGRDTVRISIRVTENTAKVVIKIVGPGTWWREPSAAQRRYLVDDALSSLGKRRVGTVRPGFKNVSQWTYRYDLERATPKPADERHP